MRTSLRSSGHIQTALQCSLAIVATCGLMLGYFVFRTFVSPLPRQYQLNFGEAKWIQPSQVAPAPTAYFRKDIFLSATPVQASLQVAATDNFTAMINGRSVGSETGIKTRIAG